MLTLLEEEEEREDLLGWIGLRLRLLEYAVLLSPLLAFVAFGVRRVLAILLFFSIQPTAGEFFGLKKNGKQKKTCVFGCVMFGTASYNCKRKAIFWFCESFCVVNLRLCGDGRRN